MKPSDLAKQIAAAIFDGITHPRFRRVSALEAVFLEDDETVFRSGGYTRESLAQVIEQVLERHASDLESRVEALERESAVYGPIPNEPIEMSDEDMDTLLKAIKNRDPSPKE